MGGLKQFAGSAFSNGEESVDKQHLMLSMLSQSSRNRSCDFELLSLSPQIVPILGKLCKV